MDLTGLDWHEMSVLAAIVMGPLGCVVSIMYAVRVDHRDSWRRPMLVTAVLGAAAVLAAYFTGERALSAQPTLIGSAHVADHRDYARALLLPTVGWLSIAVVTGWVNPRTGILKMYLPMLLTAFSVLVLALVVLSGQDGPRGVWELIVDDLR